MVVTDPSSFEAVIAEENNHISTIVFHINVVDAISNEVVKHYYLQGYQIVLIGAGIGVLADWVGAREYVSDAWSEFPANAPYWPVARMVHTVGGCRTMNERGIYHADADVWWNENDLIIFIRNRCVQVPLSDLVAH